MTPVQIRRFALSLPNAVEKDHHGIPSFRVNERIFATIWDEGHLNLMLDPIEIFDTVEKYPETCRVFWWGRRPACVQLNTRLASSSLIKKLLEDAWKSKTAKPKKAFRNKMHSKTSQKN